MISVKGRPQRAQSRQQPACYLRKFRYRRRLFLVL